MTRVDSAVTRQGRSGADKLTHLRPAFAGFHLSVERRSRSCDLTVDGHECQTKKIQMTDNTQPHPTALNQIPSRPATQLKSVATQSNLQPSGSELLLESNHLDD